MLNMREVRKLQNDINWLRTQIEHINKWMKKHDINDIKNTNSRGDESSLETAKNTRETETQISNINNKQSRQMKEELKKLHLVNPVTKQANALISLRCATCKQQHPKTPAALLWLKLEMQKDRLRCPTCNGRNFTRTDSRKPQGELMAEIIEKTKHIKRYVEDD